MRCLLFAAASLLALPATAADVSVGGVVFTSFTRDLDAVTHANAFAIERAYVDTKAKIDERFSARVTTDVGYLKNSDDTKVRPFLKYAYFQWKKSDAMTLRFGMAGNGWTGYADKFWGGRFIAQSFLDRRKRLPSADIGLYALGKLMNNSLSYQVAVVNGEGYGKPEDDHVKSVQGRISYDPLNGKNKLPISLFVGHDIGAHDEAVAHAALGVGFKSKPVLVWLAAYNRRIDMRDEDLGFTATVMPSLGKWGKLLARYDLWTWGATEPAQEQGQTIMVGLSRNLAKKVDYALVYENETKAVVAGPDITAQSVRLNLQVGF